MLEWFHILKNMKDDDLKVVCGTDGALYLIFNYYASRFFAALSLINLLIFVPIYLTGEPA